MGRGETGPSERGLMRGAHLCLFPSHDTNGKPLHLGAYLPGRRTEQSLQEPGEPRDPEQGHEVGEPRQSAPSEIAHYQTLVHLPLIAGKVTDSRKSRFLPCHIPPPHHHA